MTTDFHIAFADWQTESRQLISVRTQVFVVEQQVPIELEVDEFDPVSQHIKAVSSGNQWLGAARLLPSHVVGRMCVLKPFRRCGIGSAIMQFIIDFARRQAIPSISLNAQISALAFYRRHGFIERGGPFVEAGIEHQQMTLILGK